MALFRLVSVDTLNYVAAFFHAIQAVISLALVTWLRTQPQENLLFNGGRFSLVRVVPIWRENTIDSEVTDSGNVDVGYVAVAFFFLSAFFQGIGGLLLSNEPRPIKTQRMVILRFVEYSFSASIMMIAIALEAGVRDIYTLECMFALIWITQILGLLAEMIFKRQTEDDRWTWLIPHCSGWVVCLCAYSPALDIFLQSSSKSEKKPPDFVKVMIFLEFALFACFGFVQTYGLTAKTLLQADDTHTNRLHAARSNSPISSMSVIYASTTNNLPYISNAYQGGGEEEDSCCCCTLNPTGYSAMTQANIIDLQCEYAYIILSLTAKTLLCWIILSPILTDAIHSSSTTA